ncbi:MAG: Ig-like domain-containing protein [Candidatus Njordarchaeia archaeon]
MNKISILIMIMLIIPVSAFTANTTHTNITTNTIPLADNGGIQTYGITYEKPIIPKEQVSYQVRILFDDNHTGYWSRSKFEAFIQDIKDYYGANVTINDKRFNETDLSDYDIIILPEFDYNLTSTEVQLLKDFVEEGGSLLVMGDNDYYGHFNYPETLNATTLDYGIGWADDQVNDPTDNTYNQYYPYVHVWGNNTVADYLSNGKTYRISYYGTTLIIAGNNVSNITIYPIAFGDNDTTTYSGDFSDGNITFFMASDLLNGGRVFATGSTAMFRSDNYYYYLSSHYDNKDFAMRLIHWLMAEGLEITSVEYPTSTMKAGEITYINMTIKNNEAIEATNVKVFIEIDGTMEVLNSTQVATVGTLGPNSSKTLTWKVMATGTSEAKIVLKVWSDNLRGFSKAFTITTKGFSVDASVAPKYLLMGKSMTLDVNVTNPSGSGINASNVNVTIDLPDYIITTNDTFYHYDWVNESESVSLRLILYTNGTGEPATITINVVSDNFGTASKDVHAYIFPGKIALLYLAYTGHFYASSFEAFLNNVSSFRHVFVLEEPLTGELLNITDLVIIPNVDNAIPQNETRLLVNYLNNSGKLLIMGHYAQYFDPSRINNITKPFGVTWYDGEILDDVNNDGGKNYKPILSHFADNPYARFLRKGVDNIIFQGGTALNVTTVPNATFIPVLYGNDESYLVNDSGKPIGVNGSDIIAFGLVETAGDGLIALSGSTYLFTSYGSHLADYANNKLFIWNLLRFFFTTDFVYDTTPPTVDIVSPSNGVCLSTKTIGLNWTASDNIKLDRFEIYLNGELYSTVDASARGTTITVPRDGEYTIQVVAYDHLDYSSSDSIMVCVDSEAPALTILSPENNSWFTGKTINVSWTLMDSYPDKLENVSIYLDGAKVGEVEPTVTVFILRNVSDGVHNLTIVAADTFHIVSGTVIVRVDTTAPIIHGPAIENASVVHTRTITLALNLTDNMCLQRFEILVNGSVVYTNTSLGARAVGDIVLSNVVVPISFDAPGTYIIKLRLYDCAGNVTELTLLITYKPTVGPSPILIGGGVLAVVVILGALLYFIRRRGG